MDIPIFRKDASVQLAKIVAFLEDNPTLKIIVKVHTDSRGDDKYNRELTETQAKSIEQWLIKRGIASHRIIAKGYGATQLVNGCEKECLVLKKNIRQINV